MRRFREAARLGLEVSNRLSGSATLEEFQAEGTGVDALRYHFKTEPDDALNLNTIQQNFETIFGKRY